MAGMDLTLPPSLRLLTTHLVVALIALVVVGGATRVMEAGLACPDWPLCYGVLLPGRQMNAQVFLEWFHRLDAFLVGLGLVVLSVVSWRRRQLLPVWLPWASCLAVALVGFQGLLGALTVSQLLASSTVTAHLATALILVFLVSALDQSLCKVPLNSPLPRAWPFLPILTTSFVFAQCILGGFMASQWAVEHCLGTGDQCDWVLRHRLFAQPAALSVVALAGTSWFTSGSDLRIRLLSLTTTILVGLQVFFGILTLHWQLQQPLITITHQLLAVLLMALLGAICGRSILTPRPVPASPSMEVSCG